MAVDPISAIHNLGPATEAQFKAAGIVTASQLRALGAHEAYRHLLRTGVQPHFMSYLVLVTALAGRPWQECVGAEKVALRAAFEALKAEPPQAGDLPLGLRRALAEIGVVEA